MGDKERVYDRADPSRLGWVTRSAGMNAYVEWDDGQSGWCHYDSLGAAPPPTTELES